MSFRVYRSSAGSGKTFTLVFEYLKIALAGPSDTYRHILAITFTNKAAAEMKERVLQALREFANAQPRNEPSPLASALKEALNFSDEELKQRSRRVLTDILHNYADFSVSTIDKFTHRIVRTFAHDLRLNVGFEVSMDEKDLLARAVDQLIAKAGTEESLTKLLVDFIQSRLDDDRHWQVERELLEFSSVLMEEDSPEHLKKLAGVSSADFFKVKKELNVIINTFKNKVMELGKQALLLIGHSGIEFTSMAGGERGIPKYFGYLKEFRRDKLIPSDTVRKYVENDNWAAGKADAAQKQRIGGISGQLKEIFNIAVYIVGEQYAVISLLMLIERNIFSLALLNRIETELENLKKESNVLPISDFNKKISSVVVNEPVPFIYERIGERYHHFLIDEFQDTSLLQWQNLLPLLENALGGGNFNMVVGDAKQAIYRWRGGEVEQFVQLPSIHKPPNEDFATFKEQSLRHHYGEAFLKNNFRSRMEVVDFNNRFFSSLLPMLSDFGKAIYEGVKQEYNPANTGGGIAIDVLHETDVMDYEERTFNRIENILAECLEEGYEYNDIAVLCKKNAEGSRIAQFLISKHIPVISSESLLLVSSPGVKMTLHIIMLLDDTNNHYLITKVIEYLSMSGRLEGDLYQVTSDFFRSPHDIFGFLSSLGLHFDLESLRVAPLYDLAEEIMRTFGWMEKADPYLQALLDVIYQYTIKQGNERLAFLSWWLQKQEKFSIQVPEGTGAVHIMTVHKSKGLEFPVVIHPYATYKAGNQRSMAWINVEEDALAPLKSVLIPLNKQLEQTRLAGIYHEEQDKSLLDMLNVLYVAFTRPRERLYILTAAPSKSRSNRSVPDLLAHYYETTDAYKKDPLMMRFGEFAHAAGKKENEGKIKELIIDKLISGDWKGRITVSYRSQLLWEESTSVSPRDYGNLMHEVLSVVRSIDDLEPAISNLQLSGLITEEECREITDKVGRVLARKELQEFYLPGQKVINEMDIIVPDGTVYRPDRVVVHDNGVTVIDYKTGMEDNKHIHQLTAYRDTLYEMGYGPVSAYLVYIGGEEKIVKVE